MQPKKTLINTGDERNVTSHFISAAVATALVSTSVNRQRSSAKENVYKTAIQGGIATAGAVSATNKIGRGDYLGALLSVTIGGAAVYALEKVYPNETDKA